MATSRTRIPPGAADGLERARDPVVAEAWLGVGGATRNQRDRRDDFLKAIIEALHWDHYNTDAWVELVDYASAAPHVPTLVAMFARVPVSARPPVLRRLITTSRGQDRLGHMSPQTGEQLRAELLTLARSEGDTVTALKLSRTR